MKNILMLILCWMPVFVMADDAVALIKQAEALQAQAKSQMHAWTATSRLIAEAKGAESEAAAIEAAQRAIDLAKASLAQAKSERESWQDRQVK